MCTRDAISNGVGSIFDVNFDQVVTVINCHLTIHTAIESSLRQVSPFLCHINSFTFQFSKCFIRECFEHRDDKIFQLPSVCGDSAVSCVCRLVVPIGRPLVAYFL